jgi:hypothetical protein
VIRAFFQRKKQEKNEFIGCSIQFSRNRSPESDAPYLRRTRPETEISSYEKPSHRVKSFLAPRAAPTAGFLEAQPLGFRVQKIASREGNEMILNAGAEVKEPADQGETRS